MLLCINFDSLIIYNFFGKDKPDPITTDESSSDLQHRLSNMGLRAPSRLSTSAVGASSNCHATSPSPSLVSRSHAQTPRPATPITSGRMSSPVLGSKGHTARLVSPHSGKHSWFDIAFI